MTKKEIRNKVLHQLKAISTDRKLIIEEDFTTQLYQLPQWQQANKIAVVLSRGFEWQTRHIIEKAWEDNKIVVVPKVLSKEKMIFVRLDKDTPVTVNKGLEEPLSNDEESDMNVIIVPGVAFTTSGYRIGFGGGYYDRYLANFSGHTVSFVHSCQLITHMPIESHDIPVQTLIISNK